MTQPRDPQLACHLEKAIESGCAALVTLESMRAWTSEAPRGMTNETRAVQRQINELVESVRAALGHLRRARGEASSPLALGFVLEDADASAPTESNVSAESPRWRTG